MVSEVCATSAVGSRSRDPLDRFNGTMGGNDAASHHSGSEHFESGSLGGWKLSHILCVRRASVEEQEIGRKNGIPDGTYRLGGAESG